MTSVPFSPARGMAARLIVFGMGAMLAVAFAGATGAQTAPKVTRIDPPKSVLFVGNSYMYYNNSLHNHVVRLAREADKANAANYFFRSMTLSGAYLHEHEGTLPGIINSRKWDVIVLQGQSREPMESDTANADRFKSAAQNLDKIIRDTGAKTVFYMTWAYQDKPEMTAPLAEGYVKTANALGALVVPAGLAYERALKERPSLVLHHTDKQHPSLAGTYLVACTFFAALYNKSPQGLSFPDGLDRDTAAFLQGVAWTTANTFYGRITVEKKVAMVATH